MISEDEMKSHKMSSQLMKLDISWLVQSKTMIKKKTAPRILYKPTPKTGHLLGTVVSKPQIKEDNR